MGEGMGEGFDKAAYDRAYAKEHIIVKRFQLNREKDTDILAHIETVEEPLSSYVKRLIREDIKKSKKCPKNG